MIGILFAYRNFLHDSTGENPSCLLFGVDCKTPINAALLKLSSLQPGNTQDFREELFLSLSSACEVSAKAVQKTQQHYKTAFDCKLKPITYHVIYWAMATFPAEETR